MNENRYADTLTGWLSRGGSMMGDREFLALVRENPGLLLLLARGTPVEDAVKAVNFDRALREAVRLTAEAVEKKTVDSIRGRGARPRENGSGMAQVRRSNVGASTRSQRESWEKQALQGRKITLK